MRPRVPSVVPSEVADFVEEIRRTFLELGRTFTFDTLAGQCTPALDVYEHDAPVHDTVPLAGPVTGAVKAKLSPLGSEPVNVIGVATWRAAFTDCGSATGARLRSPAPPASSRRTQGVETASSVPNRRSADIFPAGHPASLRCSSLTYALYARSSRLAIRAPRPEYLSPNLRFGTLSSAYPSPASRVIP